MASILPKTNTARKESAAVNQNAALPLLGDLLRAAREERSQTIDMVSDELMIRRFYLDALENNAFADLPERVYATGFVRNYATYLGLDAAAIVDQFRREAYGTRNVNYQVDLSMPEPIIHSVVPSRTAVMAACILVVLVIAGIAFALRGKTLSPAMISAPPAPVVATSGATLPAKTPETPAPGFALPEPSPATNSVPATLPEAAPSPAAAAAQKGVMIEALQNAWLEIKDANGAMLFTNILKQGQLLPLPEKKITVTTGNAGGLRLVIDGAQQPALGQVNEVKRNMPLDPTTLHQR